MKYLGCIMKHCFQGSYQGWYFKKSKSADDQHMKIVGQWEWERPNFLKLFHQLKIR
jgi:hypothetical protein